MNKVTILGIVAIALNIFSASSYSSVPCSLGVDDNQLSLIFWMSPFATKINILQSRPSLIRDAAIDLDKLIKSIDPTSDFQEESIDAGIEDIEPVYIKAVSKLLAEKIQKFSALKLATLSNHEDLTKHAYSLLFTMFAYNHVGWYVSWFSNREFSEKAPWNIARNAARHAARDAAEDGARGAARFAVRRTAWFVARDAARHTAWKASRGACKDVARCGKSPIVIGKVAYRVSEKVALLYFLRNFDDIVEKSYQAAVNEMSEGPRANVFASFSSWNEFKNKYFLELDSDSMIFLAPWLTVLDEVAKTIDDLSNQI